MEEGKPKYAYTMIFVRDVAALLRFYKEAFGLTPRAVDNGKRWGELDTGSTTIAFTPLIQRDSQIVGGVQEHDASFPPVNVAIGIQLEGEGNGLREKEKVEMAYKKAVDAGAVPVQSAELKPWGHFVAYVRDPDGVLVQLSSPASAFPRSSAPSGY